MEVGSQEWRDQEQAHWMKRWEQAQKDLHWLEHCYEPGDEPADIAAWSDRVAAKRLDCHAFRLNAQQAQTAEPILLALRRVCREEKDACVA